MILGAAAAGYRFRSGHKLLWEVGPFTNVKLIGGGGPGSPPNRSSTDSSDPGLFQIADLWLTESAISVLLGLVPVTSLEVAKLSPARRPLFHPQGQGLIATFMTPSRC